MEGGSDGEALPMVGVGPLGAWAPPVTGLALPPLAPGAEWRVWGLRPCRCLSLCSPREGVCLGSIEKHFRKDALPSHCLSPPQSGHVTSVWPGLSKRTLMAKMPMTPGVCLRGPAVRRAQSFHGYARSFYRLPQAVQRSLRRRRGR